ncbi:hypothetical protein CHARACLAT_013486 [Characodon lateralis]|uniref:Tyrosine-protein phosphatase domain-containing protein n=1 Tax=Characodon lateralis TaxID=208331 RepID=A0ABU7DG99_9TELE|nr:hypothetical protein [Characodon lateralis]
MTFSASPYSDPIQITTNMAQGMDQPEMLWVMGPVLAVVVIIIIVIAILLFKNKQERKRASPLPKDEHSGGVKDSLLANSSDPVEMRRLNYQTPGPSSHRCPNTPRMREHPPIPVIDLADHIERLKANDGLRFSQEYEFLNRYPSLHGHLNVVEGFECPNDPRGYVVWGLNAPGRVSHGKQALGDGSDKERFKTPS